MGFYIEELYSYSKALKTRTTICMFYCYMVSNDVDNKLQPVGIVII